MTPDHAGRSLNIAQTNHTGLLGAQQTLVKLVSLLAIHSVFYRQKHDASAKTAAWQRLIDGHLRIGDSERQNSNSN